MAAASGCFRRRSALASASGVELRVGARVARVIEAEVVASYAVPRLITTITADSENGVATTASEPIRQMTIEGAALRVDARALVRTDGVTLDDRAHIAPALAASLFARF